MASLSTSIQPVPRQEGDHAGVAVHQHLRRLILLGRIPPGTLLKQVELAPSLGVSPTPIREAIMRLQEEGLVEAEPQRRARVVDFTAARLEAVYVQRIFLETLGARLTAERATDEKLAEIEKKLIEGARLTARNRRVTRRTFEDWQEFNRRFHLCLVSALGEDLMQVVGRLIDRSGHYFLSRVYRLSELYRTRAGGRWPTVDHDWFLADVEHEVLADAFRRRDGEAASTGMAEHLARSAVTLVEELDAEYDASALRTAVAIACPGLSLGVSRA